MAAPLSSQISSAITLGGNSSITKHVIERLYAGSGELDDKGLYSSRHRTSCDAAVSELHFGSCNTGRAPVARPRFVRCVLVELLTEILTDPATGRPNGSITGWLPVFDLLTSSRRPQTTYWWLTGPGAVAPLFSGVARGQLPNSHDPFREQFSMDPSPQLPGDLLTSTGVLQPYAPAIERIGP